VRIYLNTSAYNRPFDNLTVDRVRAEAEAVASLLAAVEEGRVHLVGSEYLEFEIDQTPDRDRARRVRALLRCIATRVAATAPVILRARALERHGLRGLDALHVAAAEAGGAELLVTTDDRLVKRAARAGVALATRIVFPPEAMAELFRKDT
jgi:predicted nucleic acid-binding protein